MSEINRDILRDYIIINVFKDDPFYIKKSLHISDFKIDNEPWYSKDGITFKMRICETIKINYVANAPKNHPYDIYRYSKNIKMDDFKEWLKFYLRGKKIKKLLYKCK